MEVCGLPSGYELHTDMSGNPFYVDPLTNQRLPILLKVSKADHKAVSIWMCMPEHDCLRARGDPRWLAACSFTQHLTYN